MRKIIFIFMAFISIKSYAIQEMTIAIGSTNKSKVQALGEVLRDYPSLAAANLVPVSVPSEVADQPLSMEETIRGAKNRAKNAFAACDACQFSFGIESGLMQAPGTQTGFFEGSICAIYDGEEYRIGVSCGFEVPPQILDLVLNKKMDLGQACYHFGITNNSSLGTSEGLIGILTKGRIDRKENTKQCIIAALVQLENANLYSNLSTEPK